MNSRTLSLAISAAISWAWAGSLLIGPRLIQENGLEVFILWSIANAGALFIFGRLFFNGVLTFKLCDNKIINSLFCIIQCICLIIQLNGIFVIIHNFMSDTTSYIVTSLVGISMILLMYKRGLETSILTDVFQGTLTILGLSAIIIYAFLNDVPKFNIQHSNVSDSLFTLWTMSILISGVITDLQHWQRAKEDKSGNAYKLASVFFALYLVLLGIYGSFVPDETINLILLVVLLSVTTSTIDSVAVALHRVYDKKIGTIIGILFCIFWGVFVKFDFVQLWANLGIVRVFFAILLVGLGYRMLRSKGN